ncbi:MAG TPA: hypothetical protein VFD71_04020 [Planctomycetota bacterium]|nr:hypothetical protein [Planctomycetota bacterium]
MNRSAYDSHPVAALALAIALGGFFGATAQHAAPPAPAICAEVSEARRAFERVAASLYAEIIQSLPADQVCDLALVLGCEESECPMKAAELLVQTCPAFTPTLEEAGPIVAGKFDDARNCATVEACARTLHSLQVTLPSLFKQLLARVESKSVRNGIELEFLARFLVFHVARLERDHRVSTARN